MRPLLALALLSLAGCGSVDSSGVDGAATDGAGPTDALSDATPALDTRPPLDAPPGCMGVGDLCSADTECVGGQTCHRDADGAGLCGPDHGGCGGFANMPCADGAAPNCLYFTGADFGFCASDFEKACLCAANTTTISSGC